MALLTLIAAITCLAVLAASPAKMQTAKHMLLAGLGFAAVFLAIGWLATRFLHSPSLGVLLGATLFSGGILAAGIAGCFHVAAIRKQAR